MLLLWGPTRRHFAALHPTPKSLLSAVSTSTACSRAALRAGKGSFNWRSRKSKSIWVAGGATLTWIASFWKSQRTLRSRVSRRNAKWHQTTSEGTRRWKIKQKSQRSSKRWTRSWGKQHFRHSMMPSLCKATRISRNFHLRRVGPYLTSRWPWTCSRLWRLQVEILDRSLSSGTTWRVQLLSERPSVSQEDPSHNSEKYQGNERWSKFSHQTSRLRPAKRVTKRRNRQEVQ